MNNDFCEAFVNGSQPSPKARTERLYNGIQFSLPLSTSIRTDRPMPVPYLDSPPEVIPIDVGRQLFIDDFLIAETTLKRTYHHATKYEGNPVLKPDTEVEKQGRESPGSYVALPKPDGVYYDPTDKLFKMWYMAGWFHETGYATSCDGIHWEKPILDVLPGTNSVRPRHHESLKDIRRSGVSIYLDLNAEEPGQRYKMLQFMFYSEEGKKGNSCIQELFTSTDGIHWGEPIPTETLGENANLYFNPFRSVWTVNGRLSINKERARNYNEHPNLLEAIKMKDAIPWVWADHLDPADPYVGDHPQIYGLTVTPYESLMLGAFHMHRGPSNGVCFEGKFPKITDVVLGYSRDGFHWHRPDRTPFIPATGNEGDWDRAYLHVSGGVCLIVEDRLWFYFGGFSGETPDGRRHMYYGGSTGIAFLRRDGFASMDADENGGQLTTRDINFSGKHLFVNVDCPEGELRAEMLTRRGTLAEPFSLENCIPVSIDSTHQAVGWKEAGDLSYLSGKPVRIRFHLTNGKLYSFWVSPECSGASNGYVAAGGPGFTGDRDTCGSINAPTDPGMTMVPE